MSKAELHCQDKKERKLNTKKGREKEENEPSSELALPVLKKSLPSYQEAMKGDLFEMVASLWSETVKFPQPPVTTYYNAAAGTGIKACLQPISREIVRF
ncbi:UNVERIFIED_CONTAM: hypothetical protein HDU68_010650 [Siphonaria sp. JEL0065]|nr:hypothetical protein HDU68_010650 [Siphonaria sp. JEL0065]